MMNKLSKLRKQVLSWLLLTLLLIATLGGAIPVSAEGEAAGGTAQVLYVYEQPGAPVSTYELGQTFTSAIAVLEYDITPLTDNVDGAVAYERSDDELYIKGRKSLSMDYSGTRLVDVMLKPGTGGNPGKFYAMNNSSSTELCSYVKDQTYRVKVEINIDTDKFDVSINGTKLASNLSFRKNTNINSIGSLGVVAFAGSFKITNHNVQILGVVDNETYKNDQGNPAVAADGTKTYYVGPTRKYNKLQDVAGLLQPGDTALVQGDFVYPDGIRFGVDGTAEKPITIKGVAVNGKRPVIKGYVAKRLILLEADYIIFDNFEVFGSEKITRGGIFTYGDHITVRNCEVHNTYADGILGADDGGSLTIEFCEVHHCGYDFDHCIYIGMNETKYPNGVLNIRYNYVHDAMTGTGIKTRSPRNNIYYNWVESTNRALELSGPDMDFMRDTRDSGVYYDDELMREDSDIVGNVLIDTKYWNIARIGGDGTGRTYGRFRFVNNTFIYTGSGENTAIKVNFGLESVEMYNNIFYSPNGTETIFEFSDDGDNGLGDASGRWSAVWASGQPMIVGNNNWISSTSIMIPEQWTATITGTDPGFADAANFDFSLIAASSLIDAGTTDTVATWPDWGTNSIDEGKEPPKIITLNCQDTAFPDPLLLPTYQAINRSAFDSLTPADYITQRAEFGAGIDLGAFERQSMNVNELDGLLIYGAEAGYIKDNGLLNSLQAKVKNILSDIKKEMNPTNALNAFENEVLAQAGKGIDAGFAEFLIDGIAYLRTVYQN